LTAFSDFRFGADLADFVTPEQYVRYLDDYCTKFQLWPHIQCASEVLRIRRNEAGGHTLTIKHGGSNTDHSFDAVAICSGLHTNPSMPVIPGMQNVPQTLHSSELKSRKQFQGIRNGTVVVVLGTGETGMDIGHLAVTTSGVKSVIMCHKEGFLCAPKARLDLNVVIPSCFFSQD
jgi:dimethylaniline monooxygenase (N-oxide forming)